MASAAKCESRSESCPARTESRIAHSANFGGTGGTFGASRNVKSSASRSASSRHETARRPPNAVFSRASSCACRMAASSSTVNASSARSKSICIVSSCLRVQPLLKPSNGNDPTSPQLYRREICAARELAQHRHRDAEQFRSFGGVYCNPLTHCAAPPPPAGQ